MEKSDRNSYTASASGPGDPDLITLKAVKMLGQVDMVFAAASTKNHHSLALEHRPAAHPGGHPGGTAALPHDARPVRDPPGVGGQRPPHRQPSSKPDATPAFLTLGDSLTYSTFGYLMKYVKAAGAAPRCADGARHHVLPGGRLAD
ncbi:MAG: SAM-dependent methyltransferase [Desulfobacterales bacterium]|nr:SAM-dependent methyltransferase [Desulfobacterales bacterium]